MPDLANFDQNLPSVIATVFNDIEQFGFTVGIIGGIPRDFILNGTIGFDFDLEVRPHQDHGLENFTKLKDYFVTKYQAQIAKYDVIKTVIKQFQIEITLPRLENFNENMGHDNFHASFIADLDYKRSFLRRDFSINAIMFTRLNSKWQIIDPLGGIYDLEHKSLRPCGVDFSKDPVRFLRAFRFRFNLGCSFSDELEQLLKTMNVQGLNSYYFQHELSKCKTPLMMLKNMLNVRNDLMPQVQLPISETEIRLYDRFYNKNLAQHIQQAVIIDKQTRGLLLEQLGYSVKGLLSSEKLNCPWKNILTRKNDDQLFQHFFGVISSLNDGTIDKEKLEYLLDFYNCNFTLANFLDFHKQKYELTETDKSFPLEHYRYQIFRGRLAGVLL